MDFQERQELFREYLDGLAQTGTMTAASRVIGKSRCTPGRWIVLSKAASKTIPEAERAASVWWMEYPLGSGEWNWFHLLERAAKREMIEDVLVGALVRARDGTVEYSYHMGRRVPCLDYEMAALVDLPPEQCPLKDPVTGEIVFETIHRHPSNELSLAVLGAYTSRFSKRVSVQHQHNHSGGVSVAHSMASRAALEATKSLPMVEVINPIANQIVDAEIADQPSNEQDSDTLSSDVGAAPTPEPSHVSHAYSPLRAELERRAREKGLMS